MNNARIAMWSAALIAWVLTGCGSGDNGQLVGVQGRDAWYHDQPYGMVYVPTGSFHMGQKQQDVVYSLTSRPKQVSVKAFYMDDTEITNNEYRQFVYWVRDSMAKTMMGGEYLIGEGEQTERVNPDAEVDYNKQEIQDQIGDMMYSEEDQINDEPGVDTRKLVYSYETFDLQEAAKTKYLKNPVPRQNFIQEHEVAIYPDTLAWVRDFTYSYNEPMADTYFFHPGYDDYPVVGVSWNQATAFNAWRTSYLNSYFESIGEPPTTKFRLPTEAEWEYAARGGRRFSPYPWGGPYLRNSKGCFLANFKPLRGNYIEDGGFYPVKTSSYFPNDYGLYNMSGNVSEWTSSAYSESIYSSIDDMNPNYKYQAEKGETPTMKRKVTRGGSWKDVGYLLQNGTRSYEYADTAKSYIGFRSVQTFIGRSITD